MTMRKGTYTIDGKRYWYDRIFSSARFDAAIAEEVPQVLEEVKQQVRDKAINSAAEVTKRKRIKMVRIINERIVDDPDITVGPTQVFMVHADVLYW